MKTPNFEFTEWVAYNYIRLSGVWISKYASQHDKDNWRTTKQLYEFWEKHVKK